MNVEFSAYWRTILSRLRKQPGLLFRPLGFTARGQESAGVVVSNGHKMDLYPDMVKAVRIPGLQRRWVTPKN